jgi:hypothetical protein
MPSLFLTEVVNIIFWVAFVTLPVGAWALLAWDRAPIARPIPTVGEHAAGVRRERVRRRAERSAYLKARAQRQIEPEGYVAEAASTFEPQWLKPDYGKAGTYEQPPPVWSLAHAGHRQGQRPAPQARAAIE